MIEAISCRAVVEAYLERIETFNSDYRAFITINAEGALAQADELDKLIRAGTYLSPLHGIPLAIKDNLETAGLLTTGGSRVLSVNVPQQDATVVARLKAAGAIILGKTNLHEFAFGVTGNNPHYGATRNPHDRSRIAGGSSGGSAAAVAARLCAGAIGTETGASIRVPAALCGVVGLKPTRGRVGRGGLIMLSDTCDVIGALTNTVEDAALILSVIAGADENDPDAADIPVPDYTSTNGDFTAVRVGLDRENFFQNNDVDVTRAMYKVIQNLANSGAKMIDVHIDGVSEANAAAATIVQVEQAHLLGKYLRGLPQPLALAEILPNLGDDVKTTLRLQIGANAHPTPGYIYLDAARTFRDRLRANALAALDEVDVLALPTSPLPAAPIGDDETTLLNGLPVDTFATYTRYTSWASIAGLPAITVPAGRTENGLPVGVQFVGRPWEEAKLLQHARTWMRLTR
jgi:aspartyl-tRNA(Asn)/glutamyl-tRNA(Gln) amidotransferase subunit A